MMLSGPGYLVNAFFEARRNPCCSMHFHISKPGTEFTTLKVQIDIQTFTAAVIY